MKAKRAKAKQKSKSRRSVVTFPEVAGKVIESVEASVDDNDCYITLNIDDRTALNILITPDDPTFCVTADYASWKTGNFRAIKRWGRLDI